jgi:hypothetical protein
VGINAQIVDYGRRGATFAPGSADALAQVIGTLVEEPKRLAELIHRGREYTRSVTLEAFQELHRSVLASHWGISLPLQNPPERFPASACKNTG